jgi:eukaryotic-like serine/threonine-protein kinase
MTALSRDRSNPITLEEIMSTFELSGGAKTLRQRLNEGGISIQDALSYAALLAEALRAIHDDGRAHGGVMPDAIALTPTGLDLLPPDPSAPTTPYTAPEIAGESKAADARSDIFSFAAVLFEMVTGRKAFEGDTEAALVASLRGAPTPNSGNPAVDRLLAGCFAKDPSERWQRIQKIQLELKLLIAGERHTGEPPLRDAGAIAGAISGTELRAEIARLESRMNARLAAQDHSIAELQIAVNEAVTLETAVIFCFEPRSS